MNGFAKGFAILLMSASTLAPSIGMAVPQELPVSNATLEIAVDADNVVIDDPVVEEVTVVGEAAGPGLWKVRNGDNTLYILGTLSPLPKKMEWRSREVERVLTRADRLIPASSKVDADIGPISAVQLYFQYRKLRGNEDKQSLQAILFMPASKSCVKSMRRAIPTCRSAAPYSRLASCGAKPSRAVA
jgi:hypothetical protein